MMVSFGEFLQWRWLEKNAVLLAAMPGGGPSPRVPGPYFGSYFGDYFGDYFDGSV